ncbi:hypothetical protein H4O14_17325 [Bacillus sp. PAMC26568]|nr:hypothetical protein H4O14_17325 [Bacillus sp. PAMC26568]
MVLNKAMINGTYHHPGPSFPKADRTVPQDSIAKKKLTSKLITASNFLADLYISSAFFSVISIG